MITHIIRKTNPRSKWPYRIIRVRTHNTRQLTHRLHIRFETKEAAQAYLDKHAAEIVRFA